jgi:UDP-N-acetylmuramoyl-tripeptide--D-alanyl-D-alanine ligase
MKKIFVNCFLWYLRTLASVQLRKINPIIIGIGGASGKSSLSQISAEILSQKYKVKQGKGKNSETGIPLNILGIDLEDYSILSWIKTAGNAFLKLLTNWEKYDIFVVEMGIDSPYPPKNMSYLLKFIKPKIGILTNIHLEHSVYFDELVKSDDLTARRKEILDKIAEQEKLLIKSVPESGRAIVNLDDEYIKEALPLKTKTVTVSAKDKSADFYIVSTEISEENFKLKFIFLKEVYEIRLSTPLPKYYSYIFIFALAIAFSNEINIKDSITYIENNFSLPPGRFSVFKGVKNTTIFDSSYNSSLEAAVGAIEAMRQIGSSKRKVGILGDMRELGSISELAHKELGRAILKNLDFTILIGPQMKEYVAPILEKDGFLYKSFDTYKEAKNEITDLVKRSDLVLVKGSQNTLYLERVVELLLLDKRDREKLCRRGKYWDRVRQNAS